MNLHLKDRNTDLYKVDKKIMNTSNFEQKTEIPGKYYNVALKIENIMKLKELHKN